MSCRAAKLRLARSREQASASRNRHGSSRLLTWSPGYQSPWSDDTGGQRLKDGKRPFGRLVPRGLKPIVRQRTRSSRKRGRVAAFCSRVPRVLKMVISCSVNAWSCAKDLDLNYLETNPLASSMLCAHFTISTRLARTTKRKQGNKVD